MANRKRLRRILQWVAWAVGIFAYYILVFAIFGEASGFLVAISIFLAPIVVLVAFWVYVEGPAELADRIASRIRTFRRQ
jgi:hypothetical protein